MPTDATPQGPENEELPSPPPSAALPRRTILKGIGLGGATIVVAATGVLSYRVFDNGVLDAGSGRPYDAWTQWRNDPSPLGAVGAAILAANPHNTQPWLFHVTPDRVEVFADPTREMPAVDPFQREHNVGMGCAVENLVLALEARGYRAAVTFMPQPRDRSHLATVAIHPGTATGSPLYDAIGERHSNRGPYLSTVVPQSVLGDLAGHDLGGAEVRWFTSAVEKAQLSALIVAATRAFIADRKQSEESFSWFRNNRDDIDRHRDGPTLDAQGLDTVTLTLAKLLPASSRTAGDQFWLNQTRTVQTATAAAYGIITVSDADDVPSRLTAGRLLQRIHLSAAARGIGLQHMNQVTEQIDRERDRGVPATFAPRLENLLSRPGRSPVVAFRIGYPVRSARPSPRRPVSAVIR